MIGSLASLTYLWHFMFSLLRNPFPQILQWWRADAWHLWEKRMVGNYWLLSDSACQEIVYNYLMNEKVVRFWKRAITPPAVVRLSHGSNLAEIINKWRGWKFMSARHMNIYIAMQLQLQLQCIGPFVPVCVHLCLSMFICVQLCQFLSTCVMILIPFVSTIEHECMEHRCLLCYLQIDLGWIIKGGWENVQKNPSPTIDEILLDFSI